MWNTEGSLVAIATPMQEDGSLDMAGFDALLDWHLAEGTDGIVVVGTTGESPTVTVEEQCQLIEAAVKHAKANAAAGKRRMPIIAGTGANSTAEAIALMRFAKSVGADACLSVVPYYNRPTQEGLYQHFKAQVEAVDLPMILYNVPGRTVADMANETVLRLAAVPGIVGLKDATDNIERGSLLVRDLQRSGKAGFKLYSGCDGTALAFTLMGGHGTISVTANVAPRLMHSMFAHALKGEVAEAVAINQKLLALHQKLFVEANPIPVKWALARMGKIKPAQRLPMTTLSTPLHAVVEDALKQAGCL
jgi:4-hydroxy-tetrahydrodipicolinate synthase